MLKSITSATLEAVMSFSWKLIGGGERAVEFADHYGENDLRAGLVERLVSRLGHVVTFSGERLEATTNEIAMWAGYDDGELSGIVAWPVGTH